ncbi:MAG TPA: MFS transporter [Vicinamibacteria bacterium]|nr:MFS transporter [Vicinamibacteria bacterium]
MAEASGREGASALPWGLVAGLAGLNVLGYVDRQLVVALAPLLITDLGLSRADVGLLVGFSFVAVFAVGVLLAGALADRWSRPRLMACGLVAWSAATGLTGAARGFSSLAAWRALVGVGESSLPASALSILGDRVPPARVGLASGVFYAGIPVGFAASFALAGWVGPWLGWRACFLILGVLGLLAAGLVLRIADPPRRGAASRPTGFGLGSTARAVAGAFAARPSLPLLILGATLLVWASASSQHTITWLVQERGFAYRRAALLSAVTTLTAGLAGNLGIGAVTDRARRRGPGGRLVALAALGAAGLAATTLFYHLSPSSAWFLPAWLLAQAWLLGWYGPAVAAMDEMAPPGRRATVIAVGLLALNLVGVGGGPWVTGLVGDRTSLTAALTWSLAPAALGAALLGAVGLATTRRSSA